MRTGGPARTVALRVCISMRGEQRERGAREKLGRKKGWGWERRTRKEGRKRGGWDFGSRSKRTRGKKVGKKGLFELSLCAKQLPGLLGGKQDRALCSFTCRFITDTEWIGVSTQRVSAKAPSFADRFESHNRAARERTHARTDNLKSRSCKICYTLRVGFSYTGFTLIQGDLLSPPKDDIRKI